MNAITSPNLIESFSFDSIPDVVTLENTFKSLSTSFGSYSGDIRSKLDEVMLGMDISNKDEIKTKLQRMTRTLVSIAELERYEKKESSYGLTDPQELAIMGMVPFLVQSLGDDGLPGTILMPTGQGKTRIPVVLQDITRGKIIYVANDTNGVEQMRSEHQKSRITGTIGLVHKDSESTEGLVIATFESFKKAVSEGRIDITKYDTIFVDEADVNGLSKKRVDFMKNLQETFGIPIVALSATEQQASGRNLDDFYTYDILNLPMPQSLPDLCRKGLLPKTRFTDVYLDADFTVSKKDISSGLQDEVLDSILDKQSDWFQNMIDHHLDHYAGKPCIFAFRNNKFNDTFVELANASGLKLATFTGNETKDERDVLKKAFEKGELHGLVGSKMIGRGLDLVKCEVVYNSMLTYSPQLFWQLGGRGIRLDRQNTNKQTELVTFLPKHLYDAETQEEFDNKRLPLSFGAFLDRSKIEHQVSWMNRERNNIKKLVPPSVNINQEFDLSELSEKDFLTMGEMSTYLHQINAYGAFQGRPEKIAEMILASPHYITINSLMFMVRTKGDGVAEFLNRKENRPSVFSEEVLDSPLVQSYLKRTETLGQLTMEKEKELVSKRDIETLLGYHYPILIALAQRCSEDRGVPFEDILQAGIEHILEKFGTFNGSTYRFSTWLSIQSFSEMMRIGHTEHWNHMYIPTNVAVMVSKVRQILDINEGDIDPARDITIQQIEDILPEATQGTREIVLDILQRKYISVEDYPEIGEEIAYDGELMGNSGYIKDPFQAILIKDKERDISHILDSIRPDYAKVLRLRFGLNHPSIINNQNGDEMTADEMIPFVDFRANYIPQVIKKAFERLNHPSRANQLRMHMEDNTPDYFQGIAIGLPSTGKIIKNEDNIYDEMYEFINCMIYGKDLPPSLTDKEFIGVGYVYGEYSHLFKYLITSFGLDFDAYIILQIGKADGVLREKLFRSFPYIHSDLRFQDKLKSIVLDFTSFDFLNSYSYRKILVKLQNDHDIRKHILHIIDTSGPSDAILIMIRMLDIIGIEFVRQEDFKKIAEKVIVSYIHNLFGKDPYELLIKDNYYELHNGVIRLIRVFSLENNPVIKLWENRKK